MTKKNAALRFSAALAAAMPLLLVGFWAAAAPSGTPPGALGTTTSSATSEHHPAARMLLQLVVRDKAALAAGIRARARREVSEIFAPLGVDVAWQWGSPVKGADDETPAARPDVRIVVIMTSLWPRDWGVKDRALGMVVPTDLPRRRVIVFGRKIGGVLGMRTNVGHWQLDEKAHWLGSALGRVIAHEVVHALAPHHPHAAGGIMDGTQSARTLTRTTAMDEACAAAFIDGMRAAI